MGKRKTYEFKIDEVRAARERGEEWSTISERYGGYSPSSLVRLFKRGTDATIRPRPGSRPDTALRYSTPPARSRVVRRSPEAVPLATVNRALAAVTPEQAALEAAEAWSAQFRASGIRRIVIDLQLNTVEVVTAETLRMRGEST